MIPHYCGLIGRSGFCLCLSSFFFAGDGTLEVEEITEEKVQQVVRYRYERVVVEGFFTPEVSGRTSMLRPPLRHQSYDSVWQGRGMRSRLLSLYRCSTTEGFRVYLSLSAIPMCSSQVRCCALPVTEYPASEHGGYVLQSVSHGRCHLDINFAVGCISMALETNAFRMAGMPPESAHRPLPIS